MVGRRNRALILAFTTAEAEQAICRELEARYGASPAKDADVIVVIGGNSAVIAALHRYRELRRPLYPMSAGYVGFLTNQFKREDLTHRVRQARPAVLAPIEAQWTTVSGSRGQAVAFNEVALYRQTRHMTHIRISVEDRVRLEELIGDGVLLATPAGSTVYNLSAHGPVLPLDARLLAVTPLAPFRPRRWRGALLPDQAHVTFEVLGATTRPASMTADFEEVRDIGSARVRLRSNLAATLLFDAGHGLEERILREQFRV